MISYSTPRLKPLVEYCSLENKIYFFNRPSVAIEMDDSSKFIATVCQLMDGKKNLTQLKQALSGIYPKETFYLETLLTVLDSQYLLEDVSRNYTEQLSSYETTRWSRNIEFFGAHCKAQDNKYSYQEKLKSAKVVIFGLGGVGSNVLYNLVGMGAQNIIAVDFDEVELSNLNRQIIYNESDVGKLKSVAARNRILQFSSEVNIEFINKKISCSANIEELIFGQDIVICAIDQPREKIMDWFNAACIKHNVPFLTGALDSRLAIYYTILPGKTGCIECWKASASKSNFMFQNLIQQKDFVPSKSPNVAIMPFMSILSGLMACEFLKIITGLSEPQSLGKLHAFDFYSSQITISESWEKNPACLIC